MTILNSLIINRIEIRSEAREKAGHAGPVTHFRDRSVSRLGSVSYLCHPGHTVCPPKSESRPGREGQARALTCPCRLYNRGF